MEICNMTKMFLESQCGMSKLLDGPKLNFVSKGWQGPAVLNLMCADSNGNQNFYSNFKVEMNPNKVWRQVEIYLFPYPYWKYLMEKILLPEKLIFLWSVQSHTKAIFPTSFLSAFHLW
jgi:hypothetical protein